MYSKYQVLLLNFQAKLQPDFLVCLLHFTEVTLRFLSDVFQNVHQLLGKLLATIFRGHSNSRDMAVPILPLAFHLSQDCQQCIHQPQISTSTTLSSTELDFNICVKHHVVRNALRAILLPTFALHSQLHILHPNEYISALEFICVTYLSMNFKRGTLTSR